MTKTPIPPRLMMRRAVGFRVATILSVVLSLSACSSCKNNAGTTPEQQTQLAGPFVFVPVNVLRSPTGIAVDSAGNVWVADTRGNHLRKFLRSGEQTDSLSVIQPGRIALDNGTHNHLLVIGNLTTVMRFSLQTKSLVASFPLSPFAGDASAAYDVTTASVTPVNVSVRDLGDIDSSPFGDIFVTARGSPANSVIRITNAAISVIAFSGMDSASTVPRFLSVDTFSDAYTSFSISRGPALIPAVYALATRNIMQSRTLGEASVSASAGGSAVNDVQQLFVADPAAQELVIINTSSGQVTARYVIPDVSGYSMIPRDVALAADGTVYVVVNDRLGSEAGAVLRYTRQSP